MFEFAGKDYYSTVKNNKKIGLYEFFLIIVLLIGVVIRFKPLWKVYDGSRPFGQGGFYIQVAKQIKDDRFRLPKIVNYYGESGYPYAYPPLLFYVEAVLLKIGFSQFSLSSWLPAIFASLSLAAMYFLAKTLFKDRWKIVVAVLLFGLNPASFFEVLPGDGLVEAFGQMITILSMGLAVRLFWKPNRKKAILLGMSVGIAVIASPGSACYVPMIVVLAFFLAKQSEKFFSQKRISLFILAIGVSFAVAYPYFLGVIRNHGLGIMTNTLGYQYDNFLKSQMTMLTRFGGSREPYLTVIGALAFLGLIKYILRGKLFVPAALIAGYFVPREYGYLIPVPMSILATVAFWELIKNIKSNWMKVIFVLMVSVYLFKSATYNVKLLASQWSVTQEDLVAVRWVGDNIEEKMVVVLGEEIEWFPTIAKKNVPNAYYGGEWVKGWPSNAYYENLKRCKSFDCIEKESEKFGLTDTYVVYISKKHPGYKELTETYKECLWQISWENGGAVVLKKI